MSDPETCLGCARKVPDESGWKEQHAEHCSPDPSAIAARARAEAFEECARIAEARAARHGQDLTEYHPPGEDSVRIQARLSEATTISERIRRRAQS